jgi:sterol 3beta-glucosyltransferase
MRITIMAIGSRGDVQPLVALGVGLRHKGHEVRLVAGNEFATMVTSAHLEFTPLGLDIQTAMAQLTNIFRFAQSITGRVLRAAEGDPDAIIATILGVSSCSVARARGIPFFYVAPIPSLMTGAFPSPLFSRLRLGRAYNRLTYRLTDGLATRSYAYSRDLFREPRPTYLFCFSPHVIRRPDDWGEFAHVTGYWFLDRPAAWRPPPDLVRFLDSGPPPVCVGFGSMLGRDSHHMTDVVVKALAESRQRGLLVAGWGGLSRRGLPSDVHMVETVPFDWLFPRVAAVVHHGGAGTTASAWRAGVPSVVIPFTLDQPFWGRQVSRLGTGPAPIPLRRLTAERLAAAIRAAVADEGMRARAAVLGERIRCEDGVGEAIRIIEQTVTLRSPR